MTHEQWFLIEGVNPEPWTASQAATGRKGGQRVVSFYKSEQLKVYQEAIKAEMKQNYPDLVPVEGDLEIEFYFWRQLTEYKTETDRQSRSHHADATNMQKALEDALQKILFKNDRWVRRITSTVVEQEVTTESQILIGVRPFLAATWPIVKAKGLRETRTPAPAPTFVSPDDLF